VTKEASKELKEIKKQAKATLKDGQLEQAGALYLQAFDAGDFYAIHDIEKIAEKCKNKSLVQKWENEIQQRLIVAAENDNDLAMYELGARAFANGDETRAFKWHRKAAAKDNYLSKYILAVQAFLNGDLDEAENFTNSILTSVAREGGYVDDLTNEMMLLGDIAHARGDDSTARTWFDKANKFEAMRIEGLTIKPRILEHHPGGKWEFQKNGLPIRRDCSS